MESKGDYYCTVLQGRTEMNETVHYDIVIEYGGLAYCVSAQKRKILIWKLYIDVQEHVHMVQCCTMCWEYAWEKVYYAEWKTASPLHTHGWYTCQNSYKIVGTGGCNVLDTCS